MRCLWRTLRRREPYSRRLIFPHKTLGRQIRGRCMTRRDDQQMLSLFDHAVTQQITTTNSMRKEGSHMPAKHPAECDRLFSEYVGSGDVESLLSLYEEGAAFVPHDRSVHTGLDNIREILSRLAQQQPTISMNVFNCFRGW